MDDYEYGVMFTPPHRHAGEIIWCPDNPEEAAYLFTLGMSVICRRKVGPAEFNFNS